MTGEELVFFLYSDISGLGRGRSFPVSHLDQRMKTGVGWVPADQALTPFGTIADPNPWGPVGDLRLIPEPDTEVRVDLWADASPLHLFVCNAVNTDGSPWNSCPRALLENALRDLEQEAGLRVVVSFEQEFTLSGLGPDPAPSFSLEAQRVVEPFGPMLVAALAEAGQEPETFLPEYGPGQYEVPCAPAHGVAAADRATIVREVVREVARRFGRRASFTPMAEPEGVGSGVHVHLSFIDRDGRPATYDPGRPGRLSEAAGHFAAGLLRHLPALCAFTAPSVISYLRLTPHRWSAGYTAMGERNREAAIRLAGVNELSGDDPAGQLNLEYRPADAAACPHLALAVLVRAGLEGLREKLEQPPLVEGDPSELDDRERRRLGVHPLPGSLEDALDVLERDEIVRSWFSSELWDCYLSLKRTELKLLADDEPEEACQRYLRVY